MLFGSYCFDGFDTLHSLPQISYTSNHSIPKYQTETKRINIQANLKKSRSHHMF